MSLVGFNKNPVKYEFPSQAGARLENYRSTTQSISRPDRNNEPSRLESNVLLSRGIARVLAFNQ